MYRATPSCAQGLLLVLCSSIIHCRAWGTIYGAEDWIWASHIQGNQPLYPLFYCSSPEPFFYILGILSKKLWKLWINICSLYFLYAELFRQNEDVIRLVNSKLHSIVPNKEILKVEQKNICVITRKEIAGLETKKR